VVVTGAQYNLAVRYESGKGVSQDYARAVKFFHQAAGGEHEEAQYSLGHIYLNGECGVDADGAEGLAWLTRSARQGYAKAQFALGMIFLGIMP